MTAIATGSSISNTSFSPPRPTHSHHCRICGTLVCHPCSSQRHPMITNVRVCCRCYSTTIATLAGLQEHEWYHGKYVKAAMAAPHGSPNSIRAEDKPLSATFSPLSTSFPIFVLVDARAARQRTASRPFGAWTATFWCAVTNLPLLFPGILAPSCSHFSSALPALDPRVFLQGRVSGPLLAARRNCASSAGRGACRRMVRLWG